MKKSFLSLVTAVFVLSLVQVCSAACISQLNPSQVSLDYTAQKSSFEVIASSSCRWKFSESVSWVITAACP